MVHFIEFHIKSGALDTDLQKESFTKFKTLNWNRNNDYVANPKENEKVWICHIIIP